MSDTYLAVIAGAVVVIAATQVVVVIVAVRAALQAREIARRLEQEMGPVLAQVRSMSADAARSAALIAVQAERVDQLAGRVTHRIDEFSSSPLREGLALVRTIVEALIGGRAAGAPAASERRRTPKPAPDDEPPV
jgi:hypothetical protein